MFSPCEYWVINICIIIDPWDVQLFCQRYWWLATRLVFCANEEGGIWPVLTWRA